MDLDCKELERLKELVPYKILAPTPNEIINYIEQLQSNWNSLREFVTLKEKSKVFGAKNGKTLELAIDLVFDMVLDKMNELEGKGRNENE